ncbi:alanyl-tRNA editing protein [Candidatus Micrarchaeota archaeon]|nr:alanyl-tRNA editing protein [Candidatus Micrarchaeota archaeon]
MTKKLFWEDPYLKECEAKAVSVNGNEVKLDRSIFYAFSGGQQSDSGTINGINILEARKNGEELVYVLEKAPDFREGDAVKVSIDWNKRYRIMKLHSAAHIVWFFFEKKTGKKEIIGSNVTVDKARIDYDWPDPITPLLPEVEENSNRFIAEGHEVKAYDDAEKPGRRIWESAEFKTFCGGTHVKNTSEIGKVKLKRKNLGAGKERIEIMLSG